LHGFNRIELQPGPGIRLQLLCLLQGAAAEVALWLLLPAWGVRLPAMLALLLIMVWLCRPLLRPRAEEDVARLVWQPDPAEMRVRTRAGVWYRVERVRFSCSVPELIQVVQLCCEGRARPLWLLITPEQISRREARRLHVALNWAARPEPRRATES
jgi:hypothetical protein